MNYRTDVEEIIIAAGNAERERNFWIQEFKEDFDRITIPYDFDHAKHNFQYDNYVFELSQRNAERIISISNGSNTMIYISLLSSCYSFLSAYIGNDDIIVGSTIYRQDSATDFINTIIPIRSKISNNTSFKDLLIQTKDKIKSVYENQNYPIESLLNELGAENDPNNFPLFDISVLLENIHDINYLSKINLNLYFVFKREDNGISCSIKYNSGAYLLSTIKNIAAYLNKLFDFVLFDLDVKINKIDLLDNNEKKLYFRDTTYTHPTNENIMTRFEKLVKNQPENIAIVDGNKTINYVTLNKKANQLAKTIATIAGSGYSIICIKAERSIELIIGILAILKSGNTYLPVDPTISSERLRYIIKDANVSLILTDKANIIADRSIDINSLDLSDENSFYQEQETNIGLTLNMAKPAYIIYTSGTTGRPKGVLINHKSLFFYINWANKTYINNESTTFPLYTSVSFDLTITSIFTPLISGNTIVVYKDTENPHDILIEQVVQENKVNIIKATPSHLKIIKELNIKAENSRLKKFIVGGEELERNLVNDLFNIFGKDIKIYNEYGPTEATVGCMIYEANVESNHLRSEPIGIPIDNANIYIIDKHYRLKPKGANGELYIAGDGLAMGYINKPELTSEKFIISPYKNNDILYKTGDLATLLNDGNIIYKGRIDNQVKIRGYRIEIGEIENCLLRHRDISKVFIDAKVDQNNNTFLCAYYVPKKEFTQKYLREFLKERLPDYMIPAYFIPIEKIPLTNNGKVDKKALPSYQQQETAKFQAPENTTQEKLVQIWAEVLNTEEKNISVNANFFEIGGHSLSATIVVNKIHQFLNVRLSLIELFNYPSIKELSDFIQKSVKETYYKILPAEKREYYPMSYSQRRLYFLQNIDDQGISYNTPFGVYLIGQIDKKRIEQSFNKLIARHDSLRTSFEEINNLLSQRIHNEIKIQIDYADVGDESAQTIIQNFVRIFDLLTAPLFRVGIYTINNEKHLLITDMHHIISDGISSRILIQDFIKIYNGEELPELTLQYKDYSLWLNSPQAIKIFNDQQEYWLDVFKGDIPVLDIPNDYPRPANQNFQGNTISFELHKKLSKALKKLALNENVSNNILLLSIFNILLSKLSGDDDIIVGTEIAGRNHSDLEKIIGMFVNTLALRNYPSSNKTFKSFLNEVKINALNAFTNQDYPFEELIEKISVTRNISRNPLFDVFFVLRHQEGMSANRKGALNAESIGYENKTSKFDISLYGFELEEQFIFSFEYCTSLFHESTIRRFYDYFVIIINTILADNETKIADIKIITQKEKEYILFRINNTRRDIEQKRCYYQLFEDQVIKYKDKIAAISNHNSFITYNELNKKANQLASFLKEKGVKHSDLIMLYSEKNLETLITILGIHKAGSTYIPVDHEFPIQRVIEIIKDSKASIIVTSQVTINNIRDNSELLKETNIEYIITLNDIENHQKLSDNQTFDKKDLQSRSVDNTTTINSQDGLAYIIYTSGTTGKPKGAMIHHRGMLNHIFAKINDLQLTSNDIIAQTASISFDISVWQFLTSLVVGGTVQILEKKSYLETRSIINSLQKGKITIFETVPSLLKAFTDTLENEKNKKLKYLRWMIPTGEALTPNIVKDWQKFYPEIKLINAYGPTEASDDVTHFIINQQPKINETTIPVGYPIQNTHIYILDDNLSLCPAGVKGEICIAGLGVGKGYWNDKEKTEKVFINNPLINEIAEKEYQLIYRTGDIGYYKNDGSIECLGRKDFQVKIRGHRIELGEIENKLLCHDIVKNAIVLAKEEKDIGKYLSAYIVIKTNNKDKNQSIENQIRDISKIKQYLIKNLPEYMVPTHFSVVDDIPLSINGKIDRKNLDKIAHRIQNDEEHISPRNDVEIEVEKMFCEILKLEKVGINRDFFDLGGNSIAILILASKIYEKFGKKIAITELFKKPVISEIALFIIKDDDFKESVVVLLNNESSSKIFCFPPIQGYGYLYKDLSRLFEKHSFYAFNFIEDENRIKSYCDLILQIQPKEPYVLFGYSSGGNLAFAVAKELETRGIKVSDIILWDSGRRTSKLPNNYLDSEEMENMVINYLVNSKLEILKDGAIKKLRGYINYFRNSVDDGKIAANIHLITAKSSENNIANFDFISMDWSNSTKGKYIVHKGFGEHTQVFGVNYINNNAELLKSILANIN